MTRSISSKLPDVGTTIFTVMSQLAAETGAINLSQGFPGFEPPEALVDRVDWHMRNAANQYAPMPGVAPLRQLIADKTLRFQERALDIEPENAWLWHRLAQVRLQQGRLDQAASFAAKSNTLAVSDPRLSAENWGLIASVRQQQGDLAGAREASERARMLGGNSN